MKPIDQPASGPGNPGPLPRGPGPHAGLDLTQGGIAKTLLIFSLPIVLQMSIQPLYGIVDRVFIGHLGPASFNAVTNAGVLMMLVINLSAGLANGVTSYVARLVGQGDLKEADNAAVHAMIIMLIFSALFILIFYPFDRALFRVLGVPPEVIPEAHNFIKVIILGNITIMFGLVGANVLRGEGDAITPLVIGVVTVGINLALAPVLIFKPEEHLFGYHPGHFGLGVMGGSLATVLSRGAGCAALIIYLLRGRNVWTFSLKNFHWHPRHLLEILRVGFPMLLVNLSAWVTSLVYLWVLNKDPNAVVAFGIGVQLDMLAVLPMIGLSIAVVAMVGQNYGAGKLDRAERAAWIGALYAGGFSGLMGLSAILFPSAWISLFNPGGNAEITRLSTQYIYIVGLTYAFVAQAFVLGAAFQGLGKGMPPLIITVTRLILVSIPILLILPRYLGPAGAFAANATSQTVGGVMAIIWISLEFRNRRRKTQSIKTIGSAGSSLV